jgi:hypothetical protein
MNENEKQFSFTRAASISSGRAKANSYQLLVGTVLASLTILTGSALAVERVFNVADYGAVGDGTKDDTIAIQAVLDAMAATFNVPDGGGRSGGALLFPAGTYMISNRLELVTSNFPPNGGGIMIRGEGRDRTAIRSQGTAGAVACWLNTDTSSGQIIQLQIEDIAFLADAPAAGPAIQVLPYAGNFEVPDEKNLKVQPEFRNVCMAGTRSTNYYSYGFWGRNLWRPIFDDFVFRGVLANPPPGKNPSLVGIYFEDTYGHNLKDCEIDGTETGIQHYSGGEGNFIGRTVITNVLTGVKIENVPFHVYMSTSGGTLINSLVSARNCGLWVKYKSYFFISNNDFFSQAGNAVYKDVELTMSSCCFVTGNRFRGSGAARTGVALSEGEARYGGNKKTIVSDNTFGTFQTGIAVGSNVVEAMVFNNWFNTATALDDNGTGTSFLTGEPRALTNSPAQVKADETFSWGNIQGTVFNVKDHGATGDGSTDDTMAVSNAAAAAVAHLNAGSLQEAVLYFPAGTYKTTKRIDLVPASGKRLVIHGDGVGVSVIDRYTGAPLGVFSVKISAETRLDIHHLALSPRYTGAGTGIYIEQAGVPSTRSLYMHDVASSRVIQQYFTTAVEARNLFQPLFENMEIAMYKADPGYAADGTAGMVITGGTGFECDWLAIGVGLKTGLYIQSNGGDIVFRNGNVMTGPDVGARIDAGGGRVAVEASHMDCTTCQLDITNAAGVWFFNTETLSEDKRNAPGHANIQLAGCRDIDIRNNAFAKSWPLFCNRERIAIRLDGTANTNVTVYGNSFDEPGATSIYTPAGATGPDVRCNRFARTDVVDVTGPASGLVRLYELNGDVGGYYLLKNKATGKFLHADGTGLAATDCGETDIRDDVQWIITWSDSTQSYSIENKALGKLLRRSGDDVETSGTVDDAGTRWSIVNRSDGFYTLANALGSTRLLGCDGDQAACGATNIADETLWEAILAEDLIVGLERTALEVPSTGWCAVSFEQPFHHPPAVFAGGPSCNDADPLTVRVRNVTVSGFEFQMEEWNYLDGIHAQETVNFIAMHKGSYDYKPTLGDLRTEAGTVPAVGTNWVVQAFKVPFASTPVVFVQCTSVNESSTVATRIRNLTPASFEVRLQEYDGGAHAGENFDFIAVEPGTCQYFEVGRTGGVTGEWTPLSFVDEWSDLGFAGSVQSFNDPAPCALRYNAPTETGVKVKVDEEGSDGETRHSAEDVGWIVFSAVASGVVADVEQRALVVGTPHGTAVPPAGTNSVGYRALLSAALANSPVVNGTTQYACIGWSGTGSVPASGSSTNTGSFALLEDSAVTWLWTTNYWLNTEATAGGNVDVSKGWRTSGATGTVTATPSAGYLFAGWSGDTGGDTNSPSMALTMDRARTVKANFAPVPAAESFDWGAGVAKRTSVAREQSIDGISVESGTAAVWGTPSAGGFSSSEGTGNGSYTLGNGVQSNGRMYFPYVPSGMMSATMEFPYDNLGSGVNGIWLGFTGNITQLFNSDNHDKVHLRVTGGGAVFMGVTAYDGTNATTNVDSNLGSTGIAAGDLFRVVLRLDATSRRLAVSVRNVTKSTTVSSGAPLNWTRDLNLTHFKIDQTGTSVATIRSLTITQEPSVITEDFDWGAGIDGRTSVAKGQSINALLVQSGNIATWSATAGTNTAFGGSAGLGNGTLTLAGTNAFIRAAYPVTNGSFTASVTGSYDAFGSGVKGYYMGFQKVDYSDGLIVNDTNDNFMVSFLPTSLSLRIRIGGVTTNAMINKGNWALAEGDLLRMEMVLDMVGKSVTANFENLTQMGKSAAVTVDWSTSAYVPDLRLFTVQMTGSAKVTLGGVSVAKSGSGATTTNGTPYSWLDFYYPGLSTTQDYGNADLRDSDGDGLKAWQEYVAGTVPTNRASAFKFIITMSNGLPQMTWSPNLGEVARLYTVEGRTNLSVDIWGPANADSHYFRVKVGMRP